MHMTVANINLHCPMDTRKQLVEGDKEALQNTCTELQAKLQTHLSASLFERHPVKYNPSRARSRLKFVWLDLDLPDSVQNTLRALCASLLEVDGVSRVDQKWNRDPHMTVRKYGPMDQAHRVARRLQNQQSKFWRPVHFSSCALWHRGKHDVLGPSELKNLQTLTPGAKVRVPLRGSPDPAPAPAPALSARATNSLPTHCPKTKN
mmetsp:Transcript_7026/g.10806  ORF Transcript_7026/g.10806 Transcript_7026/m.10806 type:complete len:205 (-) Transcript_7026:309-923(-)